MTATETAMETLADLFLLVASRDQTACLLAKGDDGYKPVSSRELAHRVGSLAQSLQGIGVGPGDRVALMADNGVHWPVVDFATLSSGAVSVPIYPTLLPSQAAYVARDSGAKVVFVQGRERLHKLLGCRSEMPGVQHFILIDPQAGTTVPEPADPDLLTLPELLERGRDFDPEELDRRARAVQGEDLATLIYTSGTTGNPKGVMLTHRNIVSNILAADQVLETDEDLTALSFLPLSHSFERTTDYLYFYRGFTIAYSDSIHTVAEDLKQVRPHVFVSVPRLYEKVLARVYEGVDKSSPLRRRIFHWGVRVGRQALPYRLRQESPPGLLGLKLALADRLVFAKIRAALGGRFRYATSGGGPLSRQVAEFFWAAGVPIFEGYGLTETAPVISVNRVGRTKLGSVGPAVPGVEVKIAADGEILARGPNIMRGYYNNPDATAELIDEDGWLHTGDIGELDEEGFLTITDRKKELLVNAYGKNIPPAPIENDLRSGRWVDQAVVIGDRRQFLTALIVPDFEALKTWAQSRGLEWNTRRELLARSETQELFCQEIARVNEARAPYEEIRGWKLLENEFTLEGGELTPTQKVKRRVVDEKYREVIDELYRQPKPPSKEPRAPARVG